MINTCLQLKKNSFHVGGFINSTYAQFPNPQLFNPTIIQLHNSHTPQFFATTIQPHNSPGILHPHNSPTHNNLTTFIEPHNFPTTSINPTILHRQFANHSPTILHPQFFTYALLFPLLNVAIKRLLVRDSPTSIAIQLRKKFGLKLKITGASQFYLFFKVE